MVILLKRKSSLLKTLQWLLVTPSKSHSPPALEALPDLPTPPQLALVTLSLEKPSVSLLQAFPVLAVPSA